MTTAIIAAVAKNLAIGNENKLLYWLPDDLRRFKSLTTGNTVVMGRRTFESLPNGALPNRRNCVLSTSVHDLPGCECFPSWEEFVKTCSEDENVFIIGGASVYRQTLEKADFLYLTEIDATPQQADTFFPDYSGFREIRRDHHGRDERHSVEFDFVTYGR